MVLNDYNNSINISSSNASDFPPKSNKYKEFIRTSIFRRSK